MSLFRVPRLGFRVYLFLEFGPDSYWDWNLEFGSPQDKAG
jgi:hypothetical protein